MERNKEKEFSCQTLIFFLFKDKTNWVRSTHSNLSISVLWHTQLVLLITEVYTVIH